MEMRRRYPQFKILPPTTNNYEVIRASRLVVSINSKSGVEGLLLGKPVIVLGEAFYTSCRLVTWVKNSRDLKAVIPLLLSQNRAPEEEQFLDRSAERSIGKERVSTCRSRCSPT